MKLLLTATICISLLSSCAQGAETTGMPTWLPKDFTIPQRTISPDGRYAVMIPAWQYPDVDSKLVEWKTGRALTALRGYAWEKEGYSMRWGDAETYWSADSLALCWIIPDKWFPESYSVLRLRDGKVVWQLELMKLAQREILMRTETAAPLNFAAAKLGNDGNGSAYPEGFTIGVSEPEQKFAFPLVCKVTLTSNPKESDKEPEENGVRAWLTTTISEDGTVSYSDFRVKKGAMSREDVKKVKAAQKSYALIETDMGKALLFSGMTSKDRRFAVGWTVRPNVKNTPPVDWSHWDKINPDKMLRLYDWRDYGYNDAEWRMPYKAVDFVVDLSNGRTTELPTNQPYWLEKTDSCGMATVWVSGPGGRRYGLIENDDGAETINFWVVDVEGLRQVDTAEEMKKAVKPILKERRPLKKPADYRILFRVNEANAPKVKNGLVSIPFEADTGDSGVQGLELQGMVTIRLADGTVMNAASNAKLINPFVTDAELTEADKKLNNVYQAVLKSMQAGSVEAFEQEQRTWIETRDEKMEEAVTVLPYKPTPDVCEKAREKSLLESTMKRIRELEDRQH